MIYRLGTLLIISITSLSFGQGSIKDSLIRDAAYFIRQGKRSHDPARALALYRKAFALREVKNDENRIAGLRVNMSSSLFSLGRTREAFSEVLTAEMLYRANGNKAAQGEVITLKAGFFARNRAWAEAEKYYKEALTLEEAAGELRAAIAIILHLADLAIEENELPEALNYLSRSKELSENIHYKTGLANTYVRLAEVYRRQQKFSKGERLIIKSALPLFRSSGYKAGRIDCFQGLGKIYRDQNRNSEAKWFFIQANTQARALNDMEEVITSLTNLGRIKITIGDYGLAKRDFNEADDLASKRADLFLMKNVKEAYAELYRQLGNSRASDKWAASVKGLNRSLNLYLAAQLDSAKMARPNSDPEPVNTQPIYTPPVNPPIDNGLIIKIILAGLVAFSVILIVLKRIK
jgi:tetratricopeptide (TPR) repeat protein